MPKIIILILLSILGLTACSVDTSTITLADGKPTLLFFYTEN